MPLSAMIGTASIAVHTSELRPVECKLVVSRVSSLRRVDPTLIPSRLVARNRAPSDVATFPADVHLAAGRRARPSRASAYAHVDDNGVAPAFMTSTARSR
jgi:hypothetical protein